MSFFRIPASYLAWLFLIQTVFSGSLFASVDSSRVHELIGQFESTLYSDSEEAKACLTQAMDLSRQLDYEPGIAAAYKNMGVMYQYAGDYDSARISYLAARNIYLSVLDSGQVATTFANTASSHYDQAGYNLALRYIDSARSYLAGPAKNAVGAFLDNTEGSIYLFRGYYVLAASLKTRVSNYYSESGNIMRLADAERDLGLIFSNQGAHERAMKAFLTAEAAYRELGDQMFLGEVHINIGNEYSELGNFDSARVYLESGMELCLETGFLSLIPVALESLGRLEHVTGQSEEGMGKLREGLELAAGMGDLYKQASIRNNMAIILMDQGKTGGALEELDYSLDLATRVGSNELLKTIYELQYQIYNRLGEADLALEKYMLYAELKDTLLNEEKSRKLAEFEILYELQHRDRLMKIQEGEIDLLHAENRIQRQQKVLLAGFVVLLVLLGVLLYFAFRARLRKNRLLHEARENEQAVELDFKKRELASYALHLAQKNQLLDDLKERISTLETESGGNRELHGLKSSLNFNSQLDRDWESFKMHFEEVHPDFFTSLLSRYPLLSGNDLRMLALLKLNLSSKEISSILNITPESVKKSRHRLRKKMELEEEANISLVLSD